MVAPAEAFAGLAPVDIREHNVQIPRVLVELHCNASDIFSDVQQAQDYKVLIPFYFEDTRGEQPALHPLQVHTPDDQARINQLQQGIQLPLADCLRVPVERIHFWTLNQTAPKLTEPIRHDMAYALLRMSEKEQGNLQLQGMQEAMRHTAQMFFLSLGIDRYTPKEERQKVEGAYRESFAHWYGPVPSKIVPSVADQEQFLGQFLNIRKIPLPAFDLLVMQDGQGPLYVAEKVIAERNLKSVSISPTGYSGKEVGGSYHYLNLS